MGPEEPLPLAESEMQAARESVALTFIHINNSFVITSNLDDGYNCVAWAASDQEKTWWPSLDDYWPDNVERKNTVESFIEAFGTTGYTPCKSSQLENDVDKVVLFVKNGQPTHMARQLPSGRWTSKLGPEFDIAHASLDDLTGKQYGKPYLILCRHHSENLSAK